MGESFISLSIKPWVNVDDFVFVQSEIYQTVIERFHNEFTLVRVSRKKVGRRLATKTSQFLSETNVERIGKQTGGRLGSSQVLILQCTTEVIREIQLDF